MVIVFIEAIILGKTDHEFESEVVLNPAASKEGDNFHINYVVIGKENHSTIGYCRPEGPMKLVECWNWPIMVPEIKFKRNVYDYPGIVKIDDLYYLSYKGYADCNAHSASLLFPNPITSGKKEEK